MVIINLSHPDSSRPIIFSAANSTGANKEIGEYAGHFFLGLLLSIRNEDQDGKEFVLRFLNICF